MSDPCLFCRIVRGEIPSVRVGETARTLSILDAYPVTEGHLLILTKTHHEQLHEVPAETLHELALEAGRLSRALVEKLSVCSYNLVQNNGKASGQLVPHAHWHLIPRHEGDGLIKAMPGKKREPGYYAETAKKLSP